MSTEMAEMNTENAAMITKVAENIPEVAETDEQKLARLATEIRTIQVQTKVVVQNAVLEIGKRLTQAKATVAHGMWGQWLKTAVDYSERTAQMLMAAYERFGGTEQKLFGPQIDPELVAQLSRSQMFALMSIKDEDDCIEFMNEHKEELPNMSKRELEQAIKERDQATQRAEKLRAELAQLKADTAAGNDELDKLKAEKAELRKEAGKWADKYNEECNRFNASQRQLDEERSRYEQQLKELKEAQENSENEELKRLQVETAVRAGKIKDLEQEIEELRGLPYAKAPEKTPEEKAFARHFENTKEDFNGMLEVLNGMPEGLKEKYRPAMQKLMEVMSGLAKDV